jgi:pyridoxamine 5'-phosphate oxidase
MTLPLQDAAPSFDEPIAVLKHCHDRIRKQIQTLQNLLAHLSAAGADLDAQQAAAAVLRYFSQAAPNHHADEEEDLLPMLKATASGDDARLLAELAPRILAEHASMHVTWHALEQQLQHIASGSATQLSAESVQAFCAAYAAHMELEETHIATMAKRLFSAAQMARLGNAMRARRGITH